MTTTFACYAMVYMAVGCASLGQLFMKVGAIRPTRSIVGLRVNAWMFLGLAFMGLSVLLSVLGMRVVPLRDIAAIIPLAYVFVPLLSRFFLKESLKSRTIVGTACIVFGMIVFNVPLFRLI